MSARIKELFKEYPRNVFGGCCHCGGSTDLKQNPTDLLNMMLKDGSNTRDTSVSKRVKKGGAVNAKSKSSKISSERGKLMSKLMKSEGLSFGDASKKVAEMMRNK